MFTTIDLTRRLTPSSLSYPGDQVGVDIRTVDAGDPSVHVTHLAHLDMHLGTHMDAPLHFVPGGSDIVDLGIPFRPAVVIRTRERSISARALPPTSLDGCAVLFDTGWTIGPESRAYFEAYSHISLELARALVFRGVALVGIDTPSADPIDPALKCPSHRILLGAGIPIVEGLCNLSALPDTSGIVWFGAFALKIEGVDGSPVRAVAFAASG
ncbi:MAG: cyclase family protein [Candidatus Bipolaricaulota bacterium]|nr:cyclase family protein [Candidatus Bipolaricaulota bacterium]